MTLRITYTKAVADSRPSHIPPVEVGSAARSETIDFASTASTSGVLVAVTGENIGALFHDGLDRRLLTLSHCYMQA